IGDCLQSVRRQTYTEVEHIVYDGASTDGTQDVLTAAQWPGLRWCSEPDAGQSDALNKAFAASSGDVIGWVNSDDGYADRRALEWVVDEFRSDPSVDVI